MEDLKSLTLKGEIPGFQSSRKVLLGLVERGREGIARGQLIRGCAQGCAYPCAACDSTKPVLVGKKSIHLCCPEILAALWAEPVANEPLTVGLVHGGDREAVQCFSWCTRVG